MRLDRWYVNQTKIDVACYSHIYTCQAVYTSDWHLWPVVKSHLQTVVSWRSVFALLARTSMWQAECLACSGRGDATWSFRASRSMCAAPWCLARSPSTYLHTSNMLCRKCVSGRRVDRTVRFCRLNECRPPAGQQTGFYATVTWIIILIKKSLVLYQSMHL